MLARSIVATIALALCLGAWPASAACIAPPDPVIAPPAPGEEANVETRRDRTGRVIAPVTVNGQGPFRFIVDTGANRSVLSPDLAARLGLSATAEGEVHSIASVTSAPIVNGARLTHGDMLLSSAPMPLLGGRVLAGEDGLLGVDGMQGRRLRMDIRRRCIEIVPSHRAPRLRGFVTIPGELRFGHLVVVRGRIRNVPVNILIDTGSDSSLANPALRDALGPIRTRDDAGIIEAFTAGEPIVLQGGVILPHVRMGEVAVTNVAAYVGDYHIFTLWGFQNEPTLLIGMDVLNQTEAVAIDYGRATVSFRLDQRSQD